METKNIALVGNPNCKTSLLTPQGLVKKLQIMLGNGRTKEGFFKLPSGDTVRVLDLPGTLA